MMANRWAPLAAVTDDARPQRPSKKNPTVAPLDASNGSGVPPAPINRAVAAVFPSPSPNASTPADFPALPSNPPPIALPRPQSAGGASRTTTASTLPDTAGNAVPSQTKVAPAAQPKTASSKGDWGYLSSERQKDKACSNLSRIGNPVLIGYG
jgi:hypothetical protein